MRALVSSKQKSRIAGAGITTRSAAGARSCGDVKWSGTLGAERWLPAGTVPLQQSSAFEEGRHFPLEQQAIALRVNVPAKQSNGRMRVRIASNTIAM